MVLHFNDPIFARKVLCTYDAAWSYHYPKSVKLSRGDWRSWQNRIDSGILVGLAPAKSFKKIRKIYMPVLVRKEEVINRQWVQKITSLADCIWNIVSRSIFLHNFERISVWNLWLQIYGLAYRVSDPGDSGDTCVWDEMWAQVQND